ncbi:MULTISPECIES: hypothetical protein [Arthrobacter]|uniref:hypothetical protein n=1 Tax=Arthrobacter TaxID=1663 RepID=UPI00147621FB|nr:MULTISPECIES: hypothetical protein [Arthrobacter]NYG17524.1 hypothetical protein [Arthrobacter psychrochitiniphilus]
MPVFHLYESGLLRYSPPKTVPALLAVILSHHHAEVLVRAGTVTVLDEGKISQPKWSRW